MLKPLGDRVILKVEKEKEETVGTIVLANHAKENYQAGLVVAVGDGTKAVSSVKVDDKVLFDKYAGTEVKYDGEDYLIVRGSDIMAIVE